MFKNYVIHHCKRVNMTLKHLLQLKERSSLGKYRTVPQQANKKAFLIIQKRGDSDQNWRKKRNGV